MHRLTASTELPLDREFVFPFFSDPGNLEAITPASLRFRITTPGPIRMEEGAVIDYRLRLLGVPFSWRTVIAEWSPPHAFADQQAKGPYRTWIHRHTFESTANGTLMTDQVDYQLPLAPLGDLFHPLIRIQLRSIFAHRNRRVAEILCPDRSAGVRFGRIVFSPSSGASPRSA